MSSSDVQMLASKLDKIVIVLGSVEGRLESVESRLTTVETRMGTLETDVRRMIRQYTATAGHSLTP